VRALLLAAGFGTRLGPLGEAQPKALLDVGGRPAIECCAGAVEALPEVAALDVVTNARFHAQMVGWADARARRGGCKPVRVWNDGARTPGERRGAMGDVAFWLARARPAVPVLLLAADNVFDFPLAPLADHARREPTVVVYDVGSLERVSRLASVELDPQGRVVRFVEKDPAPTTTLACVALYGLPTDALGEVERYLDAGGVPDNLGYFVEWLHRRRPVRGLELAGRWVDVGTPDDVARARALFPPGAATPAPAAAGGASVSGAGRG
jgi:glucose-1-phosphate thymidylyltransferase